MFYVRIYMCMCLCIFCVCMCVYVALTCIYECACVLVFYGYVRVCVHSCVSMVVYSCVLVFMFVRARVHNVYAYMYARDSCV